MILSLLLTVALLATGHAQSNESCSTSFSLLEQDFLSSTENRFQISKTFYSPRLPRPVVVKIHYCYPDGSNETWFWSESQFYLIQPLEIFQFTSLFFSNLPHRQAEVTVRLSTECADAEEEYMEILTQRMKLYASTASISTSAIPQRITDGYVAIAASLEEINADALQSDFLKVWLHVFLVLFPVCTLVCLLLCDPVNLLLGDKVWAKLEDESNHPVVAALIQVSVMFTVLVFMLDVMALIATVMGDFLIYDKHSAFYLSTLTGLIVDTIAFVWVMFVLIKSCHWDCKNFWYRWKKRQPCNHGESEKIKKLMSTIMVAPVLCFANHIHYIILALIADPFHAGGTIITYLISFGLFYFLFRQFYSFIVFRSYHRRKADERKVYAIRAASRSNILEKQQSVMSVFNPPREKVKVERVPFNTQTVVFGLMVLAPFILLYEGIIIALFASLPISKTVEDAPSRLYSIYQGTGILIVSLLTYNIVLAPKGFSIPKAIDNIAKHIQLPNHIKNWNMLTDEEKFSNVATSLLRDGGLQELVELNLHDGHVHERRSTSRERSEINASLSPDRDLHVDAGEDDKNGTLRPTPQKEVAELNANAQRAETSV